MKSPRTTRLVAIVGGSGAGKTWLADLLQKTLGNDVERITQTLKNSGGAL